MDWKTKSLDATFLSLPSRPSFASVYFEQIMKQKLAVHEETRRKHEVFVDSPDEQILQVADRCVC